MISSIRLQNWKSHLDSEFSFSAGTNVLVGRMGSGKSSVMDALSFCLFGTFPSLQSRRVSLEETIMSKPSVQDMAIVSICFETGGHAYRVERILRRSNKASEAKLFRDNLLVAGPKQAEVTAEIQKLLQIDYDLFSRAVYGEQNQIDYFLRLSPRERKEKFDELLQINRYEECRQNGVMVANRLTKISEDKKRFLTDLENRFSEKRLDELRQKKTEKNSEKEKLSNEQKEIGSSLASQMQQVQRLEQTEKTKKSLSEQLLVHSTRIESHRTEIERLAGILEHKTAAQIQAEIDELEKKILEEQKTETKIDEQLAEFRNRQVSSSEQLASLKTKIQAETKSIQKLGELSGECPLCKQRIESHYKDHLAEGFKKTCATLEQEETAETERKKQLEQKLSELEHARKNNRDQQTKTKDRLQQQKKMIDETRRIGQLTDQLRETTGQKEKIQKQIDETAFDPAELSALRDRLGNTRSRQQTIQSELKSLAERIDELNAQILDQERTREQLEQLQAETKRLETSAEKLAIFTNCLQATQSQLRETMIETINEAMDNIWKRAYPYKDFQTAKMTIENGSYELEARTKNGEWMRVEGMLSGGERSAAAICIRLAFSLVLTQNLGMVILDEPTHNLDSNGVTELSGLLGNHLPELVEQVFVITHDKEMEKAATGTLHYIERNKDNDGVSEPKKMEIAKME